MKTIIKYKNITSIIATLLILITIVSCEKETDGLDYATYPKTAEIFIDGFSGGLQYAAFNNSDVTAFDVDKEVKYKGSASMRFAVPDKNDAKGAYAGGTYYTSAPRDLSGYNCLTFWAKASKAANLDVVGFGNDLGESNYIVSLKDVKVNTNWKKYYIPIPDPSKLKAEKGMFYYSEGPEDERGYTFWIDELKFENLGTIKCVKSEILEGQDQKIQSVLEQVLTAGGTSVTHSLPDGTNQKLYVAPAYFTFNTSDENVATVNNKGQVTVATLGTTTITAKMAGKDAEGSMQINVIDLPLASEPTQDAANVIALFSNKYTNVPVEYYNGYWEPYQTTKSADFSIKGDDILFYTNLNFVGIQFSQPTVDGSEMTHLHMDVRTADAVDGAELTIKIVDFGADGAYGGDDDATTEYKVTPPTLVSNQWIGLEIPLEALATKANIGQVIIESNDNLSNLYVDNVYFYKGEATTVAEPTEAAPVPTQDAANVISVFSDTYTNITATDLNPGWGQETVASEMAISGNNTLKYAGLNYQGIQLGSTQDVSAMETLHIDFWSANATALKVFLISDGPKEKPYVLTVPTTGWSSVDIPLTEFSDIVDLTKIIQLKFEGDGDVYVDNIYFYKSAGATACTDTTLVLPINFDCESLDYESKRVAGGINFSIVDNPQVNGVNAVATKVGEIVNLGANWENLNFTLDTPIDFTTNKSIKLKLYSTVGVPVKLKVETGGTPVENDQTHGGTGWEELTFTLPTSESFSNIIVFIDGPGTTAGTFYIDDIEQVASSGGTGNASSGCTGTAIAATSFPVNFESCESFISTFTGEGSISTELAANPAKEGINTSDFVLKVVKATGTNRWAGFQNPFPSNFDATKTLKVKVYSSKANVVMRFEINSDPQDANSGNPGPQFATITTANTWTEVSIVFTGIPDTNTGVNQLVIKPDNPDGTDGETTSSEGIYYFDDIRFE